MSTLISNDLEPVPQREIARRFVKARLADAPLCDFPGRVPDTLLLSYACQDAAIELWADETAGWKIGRISDTLAPTLGANRLAGPIFRRSIMRASFDQTVAFPTYTDGFAAIEAEFVLVVGQDAPAGKLQWSLDEARAMVRDVLIGIELAGSPLASINDLGPTAVVSDFGNNAGLILGPSYQCWRDRAERDWRCEAEIDGKHVGAGDAAALPGGPFEALRFLLELNATRGRPLRAGDLISSGAVTGVHDIKRGETGRLSFEGAGVLSCRAEARR